MRSYFGSPWKKKKYPLMEGTISGLDEQFNPNQFFGVNRSDIVNINFIHSIRIEEGNDYTILLKNIEEKIIKSQSRIT